MFLPLLLRCFYLTLKQARALTTVKPKLQKFFCFQFLSIRNSNFLLLNDQNDKRLEQPVKQNF